MWNTVGVETALLTVTRFSLFYSCRKYLLRTLYSNLTSLSKSSTLGSLTRPHSPNHLSTYEGNSIELETLPPPATHTPTSGGSVLRDATYLHTAVSGTMFSWCFAESCMLFLLLILQGWGILSPSTRLINWRFSLIFLVFAILLAIPVACSLLLSLETIGAQRLRNPFSFRAILAFITIGFYLFALSYIPVPASLEPSDIFTGYLSRLIVLGTIILGLLSGFGAISSSWQFLPTRNQIAIPSEQDIETAQYALNSVRNDIKQRLAEAARRVNPANGSWFSRMRTSIQGGVALSQELEGLEALEYQMSRNLEALRERRNAEKFAKTFKGMVFNTFGKLLTAYCIIRIISSIYNVIFLPASRSSSSSTYPDLLTDLLFFLFTHLFSSHEATGIQYESLSGVARQISLVLVGLIILSSIRLVLKGVTRTLRVTSRTLTTSLIILVLAQIMGIYLLSTVVQMRSSFPPPPRHSESEENLFTTIPAYEMFGSLFDWSFLIAAASFGVFKWGAENMI